MASIKVLIIKYKKLENDFGHFLTFLTFKSKNNINEGIFLPN